MYIYIYMYICICDCICVCILYIYIYIYMVRAAPVIYLALFLIQMMRAYELILNVWYHESWRDLTKSNLFERDSNGTHMCGSTN